ncbi:MAG: SLC13 family permease, partial [Anaerolineae bacterium]
MNNELVLTLVILAVAIVMFLSERLSVDLVALFVLVALGLSRILTPQEVFSGFSDTAVITIMAIFILAYGLEVTGIAERIGELLMRSAKGSETRLIITLMATGAFLSLFMNNIAAASILLPAASTIAKKSNVKLSHLLMPLAFGTLLGGTATLFATTNIVVSGILKSSGYQGFNIYEFAPVGLPLIITGIVYMALWGRRLLPAEPRGERADVIHQAEADLLHLYQLGERLFRVRIPAGSSLIEKDLAESTLREKYGLNVVGVELNGGTLLAPEPDFVIQQGDVLLLEGRLEEFRKLDVEPYLEILPLRQYTKNDLESASTTLVEAVLSPRSQLIGRTLKEARFRDKYGMMVLAIWNGERVARTRLSNTRLTFGDALLLQGPRKKLPLLHTDPNLIVLSEEDDESPIVSRKGWLALTIFILTVIVAAIGWFSVSEVMLTGALVMLFTNIVTMEEVYHALVLGTRDYLAKTGFKKAVLGLSGGIDSALTAAVAVDALGKENVAGVTMPSQYTSRGTRSDAETLARNLGIKLYIAP